MKIATLHHIASNDRMLSSLGLAIEEAKMARSLLRSREDDFRPNEHFAEKLESLEHEIDYLEAKLIAVRSNINRD